MNYQPQPRDAAFLIFDVLRAPQQLAALPQAAEADTDLLTQVLDAASEFVGGVVAPLNATGDAQGCRFDAGTVHTPDGFRAAYQAFWQTGWPALACDPQDGGQGLPAVMEAVLYEWLSAANHGWTMAPGLLHGAYECLKHHGSETLKAQYLGKIASGEWLATMCLTEPHAGSDLGLVRTRAMVQPDGSHRLSGSKIFISGGEHDLSDNIVHLVLARLPDAPPGPKGLSLFLAPKFLPDGTRNTVHCDRIEEKMGLHGSPTCAMRFDEATGWLVGEAGRGLAAMFVMMNAARLHVALQGLGLLDAAWQKADAYARERRQMRVPGQPGGAGPDAIIGHPAMQRILDTQRAWIDGGRVLAYQTALELDIARHHPDAARRDAAQRWCSLVTPVLKAAFTDQAFHGASDCLQVFGGHGYIREWGIEQIVRDARVTMIYEGTNEIQAIDLLVRKVMADGSAGLSALLDTLLQSAPDSGAGGKALATSIGRMRELTRAVLQTAASDVQAPYWFAGDYLRLLALLLLQWAWQRIEATPGAHSPRWQAGAQALQRWVMPEFAMRVAMLSAPTAGAAMLSASPA